MYKPQLCGKTSRILVARRKYAAAAWCGSMDSRQKPVAEWMLEVLDRTGLSARAWAEKAKLGKDTVSRAIRDDYKNVTTTRTLAALADAIGERPPGAAGAVPSAESLEAILQVVVDAAQQAKPGPHAMRELSLSLRETLLALADEPAEAAGPEVSRALARSAIRRTGLLAGIQ
jgi:hypothetical protein